MNWKDFDWLVDAALEEDAVRRDVTASALIPARQRAVAEVRAGGCGVICGVPLARRVAMRFDRRIRSEQCVRDGSRVSPGAVVARLRGPAASILSVERTMLNFLQKLSGVATLTAQFVGEVKGTKARIYDTRKTSPGWRQLEKYAVRCGGGRNHRMNLADQGLIKDNHLALLAREAEGVRPVRLAVEKLRAARAGLVVEVEVRNLAELKAALAARPDIIMLDNMKLAQVRRAIRLVHERAKGGKRPLLEASGAITLANVRDYAAAGVDRISIGALTHSAPALDLSLDVVTSDG